MKPDPLPVPTERFQNNFSISRGPQPSRLWRWLRSRVAWNLRAARFLSDGKHRLDHPHEAEFPFVLAEAVVKLREPQWEKKRGLTRGKIENLRRACRTIGGAGLSPGEIFSFWNEVGPPWRVRGFRMGDEVRSGYEMPVIGGGLGLLSGALFEAASQAGLMVIERHASHFQSGDREFHDVGADVRWGELDLRLAAPTDEVRIEARMTPDELIVRIRGRVPILHRLNHHASDLVEEPPRAAQNLPKRSSSIATQMESHIRTAAILDGYVPEFESYLSGELIDLFLVPANGVMRSGPRWFKPATARRTTIWFAAWKRTFELWRAKRQGRIVARVQMKTAEELARALARRLPYDIEHVIVSQDFLPFLWRMGALAGRSFDVLLTRPPLSVIHEKLDRAHEILPSSAVLKEYRAERSIVEAESEAFVYADRVITPHEEFAKYFPNLRKLEWQKPVVEPPADVRRPQYLLFPASLAAHQGAHAALAVADEVGLPLLVAGEDLERLAVSSDQVQFVAPSEIPWHEVAAVVHPTLFAAWPRLHLHALALGIPVIASEACGLEEGHGLTIVPFADEKEILSAVERALMRESDMFRETRHLARFHSSHSGAANHSGPESVL